MSFIINKLIEAILGALAILLFHFIAGVIVYFIAKHVFSSETITFYNAVPNIIKKFSLIYVITYLVFGGLLVAVIKTILKKHQP